MKIYYLKETGFIEFFLTDHSSPSYADYLGPRDEVTVFYNKKTNLIQGYAIEDISHLKLIDLSLEEKLAIMLHIMRKNKGMTQNDFVKFINQQAGKNIISYRNYQRLETSDRSGAIGMSVISSLMKIFPKEKWEILTSQKYKKSA